MKKQIIIRVKFVDWNNIKRVVEVTDEMCAALRQCRTDIDKVNKAYRYVVRRHTELIRLTSIEIV